MAKASKKLAELSTWKTEMLRLTAFHRLGPQSDDNGWWESTVGAPPESKNLKPREGGLEVSGPVGTGVLTLRINPFRYDWIYTASFSLEGPPTDFPTIGQFPDALAVFLPLMNSWLGTSPETHRIAFGTTVLHPVTDRISGYKLLGQYLPSVILDPENSSEFSYSINRHWKASEFENIHINRISKWAVAHIQPVQISMTMGLGQKTIADSVQGTGLHAMRVEIDINTDADRQEPLLGSQLQDYFKYLEKLGEEIILKGDVK